ncbi:MAG: site-2 protease family protein [Gemmataceae bacterium]
MDTNEPAAPQPRPDDPVAPASVSAPSFDEPATPAGFLVRNGVTLAMVALFAAAVIYFFTRVEDSLDVAYNIGKVAVGLGLVIFIHELGHFVAAKLCDVHVETFSVGFGPAFLGVCAFKWGETTYKLAWFPLGGYVKMLGEGDGEDGAEDDPRSFKNKSVWQRMVIISAGVVMNVLLAVVCFIFVYMTHGINQHPGVMGHIEPGAAAWKKGMMPGAYIERIADKDNPYYEDIQRRVMNNRKGQPIDVVYDTYEAGRAVRHQEQIVPATNEDWPVPILGIQSASIPVLLAPRNKIKGPTMPESAAARAQPAFEFNDRVLASSSDPDDPEKVTPLPPDPRRPDGDHRDFFELRRRMQRLAGKPMILRVQRAGSATPIDVRVPAAFAQTLGVRLRMSKIVAIRDNSPAAKAGVRARDGAEEGDEIASIEVTRRDGAKVRYSATPGDGEPLDPLRLPTQLALWAIGRPTDWRVRLTVLRTTGHQDRVPTPVELTWDSNWDPLDDAPVYATSPMSLAGLGLAYRVQTVIDGVDTGSPAAGTPLKPGDVITSLEIKRAGGDGKPVTRQTKVKEDMGASYFSALLDGGVEEVTLTVNGGDTVTLKPREDPTWPLTERGIMFQSDSRLVKANGVGEAIALGTRRLASQMASIYENLYALATRRIPIDAVAGPLSISKIAYDYAERDIYEFILFLALININLAVVNFLPIPVLDGGHMVFLIYEKLRGKPPSDQVRFIATICGLVIVLGLMVFTFSVDIRRLFFR